MNEETAEIIERVIANQQIGYNRLLGEFIGTLEGILYWDIPTTLKLIIEQKIKELREKQVL
jgi:hypothetical protein